MKRDAIEAWLRARRPERPGALTLQMSRSVGACPTGALDEAASMSAALGVLGLRTLALVTRAQTPDAQLALELLAADAFVTYAFEAAAEEDVAVAPFVCWLVREAA